MSAATAHSTKAATYEPRSAVKRPPTRHTTVYCLALPGETSNLGPASDQATANESFGPMYQRIGECGHNSQERARTAQSGCPYGSVSGEESLFLRLHTNCYELPRYLERTKPLDMGVRDLYGHGESERTKEPLGHAARVEIGGHDGVEAEVGAVEQGERHARQHHRLSHIQLLGQREGSQLSEALSL